MKVKAAYFGTPIRRARNEVENSVHDNKCDLDFADGFLTVTERTAAGSGVVVVIPLTNIACLHFTKEDYAPAELKRKANKCADPK